MKIPANNKWFRKAAFSLVEVMIVVAVIAILALTTIATVTKVKPAAELSKLQSDVQNLNTAVKVYRHSGGDLTTVSDVAEVIAKLKTIRQKSTAQSFVGYTGSMLDSRLSIQVIDSTFDGARAVYDKDKQRFYVTTDKVEGYRFALDDLENRGDTEETRGRSALEYSYSSSWVWDYEDVSPPERLDPTLVTKVDVLAPPAGGPGSVETPTGPEAPVLEKLAPPVFSIPSDFFPLGDFPMSLTLNNPNDPAGSKIIYGIVNRPNWEWLEYAEPIAIKPGDNVLAFVESLEPTEFHHSDPRDEHYDWSATLSDPEILVSDNEIDARAGSTNVMIIHANNASYFEYGDTQLPVPPNAFTVQYRLIPSVPGEGTATGWTGYQEPFDVGGPQFPRGFDVVARVISNVSNFNDSSEVSESVSTYYQLDPPLVASSVEVLANYTDSAVITLSNPNPSGSSSVVYRLLDDDGNTSSGWLDYTSPFVVSGTQYPGGFTVASMAVPLDSYYRESPEGTKTLDVNFFGIEVTGKTIFVLDSSGSMRTNDRITRLRNAAITVVNLFDADDDFAIIDYDSSATVLIGWGPGTTPRKNDAISAIQGIRAGGGTRYNRALQSAIALNASGAEQVIFLSDGYPNDSTGPILQSVDTLIAGGLTQVDTVALGSSQPILRNMAERGNGTTVVIPD